MKKKKEPEPWLGKPGGGPRRKYKPGLPILYISDLAATLRADRYVYLHGRPIHPGWLLSMQFRTVLQMLSAGVIKEAIPND